MKGNERREKNLRNQLKNYAEKFEQFQETLLKSSDVFSNFKYEMERVLFSPFFFSIFLFIYFYFILFI